MCFRQGLIRPGKPHGVRDTAAYLPPEESENIGSVRKDGLSSD